MGAFALLGLIGLAAAMSGFGSSTESSDTDEENNETPGETFDVVDGADLLGTDGDDFFAPAPEFESAVRLNVTIDAGEGDDTINFPFTSSLAVDQSNINGGAGDDMMHVAASFSTISGGTGDDTLTGDVAYSTLLGGEGNDYISVDGSNARIFGGEGDDTIDAEDATYNGWFYGDEGDDLIIVGDPGSHSGVAYGGEGDDTIQANLTGSLAYQEHLGHSSVYGEAGEDVFHLNIDAGDDTTQPFSRAEVLRIADFESGVDSLVVEQSLNNGTFALSEVSLQQVQSYNTTDRFEVTLSYEFGGDVRDVVVRVNGSIALSDIEIEGNPNVPLVQLPSAA